MDLSIKVETKDNKLGSDLFETESLIYETEKEIADGLSIRFQGLKISLSADIPIVIQIVVLLGENIVLPTAASLLSSYLYDKLKNGRAKKVTINN